MHACKQDSYRLASAEYVVEVVLTLFLICSVARSNTAMAPLPVQHHRSDPTTAKQCTMLPKAFAGTS